MKDVAYYRYTWKGRPDGPDRGKEEFGISAQIDALAVNMWTSDYTPTILEQGRRAMEQYMIENSIRWADILCEKRAYDTDGKEIFPEHRRPALRMRARLSVTWETDVNNAY